MALTAVATGVAVLFPAAAASAADRTGVVTVSIPSRVVIDGEKVAVRVSSESLYSSLDRVYFNLYLGDRLEDIAEVQPNTETMISTAGWDAGSLIGKADLATTDCSGSSEDPCHLRKTDLYYYEFIDGLTYQDSAAAVAKYGSRVALTAVKQKRAVVWTAATERYDGGEWVAFKGASVTIGTKKLTADRRGRAIWTEKTTARHRYRASVTETETVWSSSSRATTPTKAAKKAHLSSSSSAAAVGSAIQDTVPSISRVRALTRSTDPNKLLGRPNGYTSAAVLYDSRTECSDGPGADCGATVERWPSAAKAKARSKYILTILDRLPALGSEYHAVEGRFLLRVAGDLTVKQATAYKKAFRAAL